MYQKSASFEKRNNLQASHGDVRITFADRRGWDIHELHNFS